MLEQDKQRSKNSNNHVSFRRDTPSNLEKLVLLAGNRKLGIGVDRLVNDYIISERALGRSGSLYEIKEYAFNELDKYSRLGNSDRVDEKSLSRQGGLIYVLERTYTRSFTNRPVTPGAATEIGVKYESAEEKSSREQFKLSLDEAKKCLRDRYKKFYNQLEIQKKYLQEQSDSADKPKRTAKFRVR